MPEADKERKPWAKPMLRKIALTGEEAAELKAPEDPLALYLKRRRELSSGHKLPD